jgi:hypothetical protein
VSQHSGAVSQHSGLCLNTVAPRLDRTALPARPQHCSSGSASSEFCDYATMGSRSRSAGGACVSTQSGTALRPAWGSCFFDTNTGSTMRSRTRSAGAGSGASVQA